MSDQRSRSASPARDELRAKKQKTSGFKWKERKAKDEDKADERDSGKLERGYRNRSPRRESYREREHSPRRGREDDRHRQRKESARHDRDRETNDPPKARQHTSDALEEQKSDVRDDTASKFNLRANDTSKKDKKPKKPKTPVSSEPMIIVNINDRLGTKAAIPCLASDSIKAFKAVVAAHIGRQPHEIMLKRQGERPFKDQLSLQDYGVSNGVQLDLELDTGD